MKNWEKWNLIFEIFFSLFIFFYPFFCQFYKYIKIYSIPFYFISLSLLIMPLPLSLCLPLSLPLSISPSFSLSLYLPSFSLLYLFFSLSLYFRWIFESVWFRKTRIDTIDRGLDNRKIPWLFDRYIDRQTQWHTDRLNRRTSPILNEKLTSSHTIKHSNTHSQKRTRV